MAEDILIPLGGMLLSGWIIYTIIAGIQNWHQRRTQAIFQSKMLDKIGSVNELGTFLNTEQEPTVPAPRYEDDATVAQIFAELKPRERALLWLAYVEGESHEEIAASLGVRPSGVRVLLFRARRRLRDLLQARGIVVNR